MRSPDRIDPVIELLRQAWDLNPDWRLGQLVVNFSGRRDPFFIEDDELEKALRRYVEDNA